MEEHEVNSRAKKKLEKQLQKIDTKINNLVKAVSNGFDIEAAKGEMDNLKKEKAQIESTLKDIEEEIVKPKPIDANQIYELYQGLETAFQSGDNAEKRKLLRVFVRRLEYDPQTDDLKVFLLAEPVSTTVCHSCGAQDRT